LQDKITGMDGGADHYLAKTADLDELAVTLVALRRRLGEAEPKERWVLELGPRQLRPPGAKSDTVVASGPDGIADPDASAGHADQPQGYRADARCRFHGLRPAPHGYPDLPPAPQSATGMRPDIAGQYCAQSGLSFYAEAEIRL